MKIKRKSGKLIRRIATLLLIIAMTVVLLPCSIFADDAVSSSSTDSIMSNSVEAVTGDAVEEGAVSTSSAPESADNDEAVLASSDTNDTDQDENEILIKRAEKLTITSDLTLPSVSTTDFSLYGWDETAKTFGTLTNITVSEVYWQKYVDGAWVKIEDNNAEIANSDVRYGLRFVFTSAEGYEFSDDSYFEGDEAVFDIKTSMEEQDSVRNVRLELNQSSLPDKIVATIGNRTFTDFDQACDAARKESKACTIVLCGIQDAVYKLPSDFLIQGDITIELNGRTLTLPSASTLYYYGDGAKFTLKNRKPDFGGFILAGKIEVGMFYSMRNNGCSFDYMDLCFNKTGGFLQAATDEANPQILIGETSTVYVSKDVTATANDFAKLHPNLMYCMEMAFACIASSNVRYYSAYSAMEAPAVSQWQSAPLEGMEAYIEAKDSDNQQYARFAGTLMNVLAEVRDDERVRLICINSTIGSDLTINQSFTFDIGVCDLTIADGKTVTIERGKTVTCCQDYLPIKLVNNGRVELCGTLDLTGMHDNGGDYGPIYINDRGTLILNDEHTFDEYLSYPDFIHPDLGAMLQIRRTDSTTKETVTDTYQYLKNVDGKEVWADLSKKHTVQLKSRIAGTDISLANVSGGGEYYSDIGTTIQADGVEGYEFIGWYSGYSKDDLGTCVSSFDIASYYPSSDVLLTAVYRPTGTFNLTIEASKFTITDNKLIPGADQIDRGVYSYKAASDLYLSFTDQDKSFLYWTNGSDMIVSKSEDYDFTIAKNTTLRAVYNNSDTKKALVVFKSDFGQIMSAGMYSSTDTITLPSGPSKTGFAFICWSMSAEEIKTAIANGSGETIEVTPVYAKETGGYNVTVKYVDADGNKLREDSIFPAESGSICKISALNITGKTFSYWSNAEPSDKAGKILSYNTLYKAFSTDDITIYAVYGADVAAGVAVNITSVTRGMKDSSYKMSFAASYDVPEGLEVIDTGFVMTMNETYATADSLMLDQYSVKTYAMAMTENYGAFIQHLMTKNADKCVWMRAFVQVKDPSSGNVKTYYSDIVNGSYNTISD